MLSVLSRNRLLLTLVLALGLMAAAPHPAGAAPDAQSGELLVGFEGLLDLRLISLSGGETLRSFDDLGVAHVYAADVVDFTTQMLLDPSVAWIESDDRLRSAGSSPDASTWDASTWDASTWDASTWDASTWDASTWDASTWDASTWDASTWDASTWDASTWDASTWDASTWDASTWDASTWDASTWDWGVMDPGYGVQWGLGAAGFPAAWRTTTGSGSLAVCILDTGVDATHSDLLPSLLQRADGSYGYNAMRGNGDATDDVGHGTHVAGVLGAVTANGTGVAGAARASIMSVKVMNATGGEESDLVNGLLTCARDGARIATMSLHIDEASPAVERAIRFAQDRGLLVVASSGNAGADAVAYPAAYDGVLAVGAVTPSGAAAGFSNGGAALDLVAPGYRIASTFPGGYAIGSGTSQAAPFAAAAAVLVWDVAPHLNAAEVAALLTGSARDVGEPGFDARHGHGALDAATAVAAAAAAAAAGGA